jgi:L-asparaginase
VTASTKPRIAVISLGGTIASTSAAGQSGVAPSLDAGELLAGVGDVGEIADVRAVALQRVASSDLTLGDALNLAREVEARLGDGASAVVVTQGTDTLEEMAFALDLLVAGDAPVVLTGAMRNTTEAGADGPANLLDAVRVAVSPAARGLGALVVMNGEIHAARFVRKSHATSTSAFLSASVGPLGWISEGRVRVALSVTAWPRVLGTMTASADIALIAASLGDDLRLVSQVVSLEYRGVVIDALGGGHVPSVCVDALEALSSTVPVVIASRTGAGDALRQTYRFAGSEIDVLARGPISAGALDARKARVLLSLLVGSGADVEDCRRAFAVVNEAMFRE